MDEAVELLRTNHGVTEPRPVLEAMAARFPSRPGRVFLGEEGLDKRSSAESRADAGLAEEQARAAAGRAAAALDAATRNLASQDRLILRMRFDDGATVADIARLLQLEPKPLYRRIERMLAELRAALEAVGIRASDAADVLEHRGFDLAHAAGSASESGTDVRQVSQRAGSPVSSGRAS
jgi:RNA polymerase sigma factor for flagellar operon FliA